MSTLPLALVTGASRGLGAEIAYQLSKQGYHILVNFQSSQVKAQSVVDHIHTMGGSAELFPFDVGNTESIQKAFKSLEKRPQALEVLVNNAGIAKDALLLRVQPEDVDAVLSINLKGVIYCTKEASRLMLKHRKGSIIQIASVVGECGNPGQSVYAASKAAIIGFSKSVARELASRNIRINVVSPGFIETDMTLALSDDQRQAILRNIPLGRVGKPEDIAYMVCFLASMKSQFITGEVVRINGGQYS